MWKIWDKPSNPASLDASAISSPATMSTGRRRRHPARHRTSPNRQAHRHIDTDEPDPRKKLIIDEHMDVYPHTYTVQYYGYHPNEVALSFDDGPDPKWTPKILDILKKYNVKGTFMVIGEEAQDNIGLMQRSQREGHEIGNHTYFHPDISEISNIQVRLELNLTERLFASQARRAAALLPPALLHRPGARHRRSGRARLRIQQMGYTIVGNKIDTNDWDEHPRKTPQESPTASSSSCKT